MVMAIERGEAEGVRFGGLRGGGDDGGGEPEGFAIKCDEGEIDGSCAENRLIPGRDGEAANVRQA